MMMIGIDKDLLIGAEDKSLLMIGTEAKGPLTITIINNLLVVVFIFAIILMTLDIAVEIDLIHMIHLMVKYPKSMMTISPSRFLKEGYLVMED